MHRVSALLVGIILLALVGCERGAEVTFTSPRDGAASVSQALAEVRIEFSTTLEDASANLAENYSFVGSQSGELEFDVAATASGGDDATTSVLLIPTEAEPSFTLVEGEVITVKVTNRVRGINQVPVQRYAFQFTVSSTSGTPEDFDPLDSQVLVISTDPSQNSRGAALRPGVAVELSNPVTTSLLGGQSVTVRGEVSGARSVTAADINSAKAGATTAAFSYGLGSGQRSFLPGERVTLSLGGSITGTAADGSLVGLRPYVLDFEIQNGTLTGSFTTPKAINPDGDQLAVVGVQAGDYLFFSGLEVVVLDQDLGLQLFRKMGTSWTRVATFNDFSGTPVWLGQADHDNDGMLELVVLTRALDRAEFFSVEAESFVPLTALTIDLLGEPRDAISADLNGDGYLDLAIAGSDGVTLLEAQVVPNTDIAAIVNGGSPFTLGSYAPVSISGSSAHAIEAGDLFADGRADLVVANQLGIGVYRNASDFEFFRVEALDATPAGPTVNLVLADIVGDEVPEVIVSEGAGLTYHTLEVDPGSGARSWLVATVALVGGAPDAFRLADLDGDAAHRNDLVTYHRADGRLRLHPGGGVALFEPPVLDVMLPSSLEFARLACFDLNGDGGRDILAAGMTGSGSGLFLSTTSGVNPPDELPEFVFRVSSGQAQLGSEFSVTVSADLGEPIAELAARLTYDSDQLELVRIDPAAANAGLAGATVDATITDEGPGSAGLAVLILNDPIGPGGSIPVLDYVFRLRTSALASYQYQLANGTGSEVNRVVTAGGQTLFPDISSQGSGEVLVTTSVPGVENLTCTPRSVEVGNGDLSHFIDLTWQIPAGAVYDTGPGSIVVKLNGQDVLGLQGTATTATVPGVVLGANTVSVVAHQGGLPSAATTCSVFLVAAPSSFTCNRFPSGPGAVVELAWQNNDQYTSLRLYRDGAEILSLSGSFTGWSDNTASLDDGHLYELQAVKTVTGTGGPQQQLSPRVSCLVPDQSGNVTPPAQVTLTIQGLDEVVLSWSNAESYQSIEVLRNGTLVADLPGIATSFSDPMLVPGSYTYLLRFYSGGNFAELGTTPPTTDDFGSGIELAPPTSLTCTVQIGAGQPDSPAVQLVWANPASYDELQVTRLLGGIEDAVFTPAGGGAATTYLDGNVPEGNYTYRVDGILNGVVSSGSRTCAVTLSQRVRVPSVTTVAGTSGVAIAVRGQLLAATTGFSFSLRVPSSAVQFSNPPTVLRASGVPMPASQVTLTVGASQTTITVNAPAAVLSAGSDVLLATIMVNVPTTFTTVGSHAMTLMSGSYGGTPVSSLQNGTLTIVGDALIIDPQTALPGDVLDFAVYGTFDQAIAGVQLLLDYDPQVVTLLGVSSQGTVIPGGVLFESSDAIVGYSRATVISLAIPPGSAAPAFRVPLMYYSFSVSPTAAPGANTGIRLAVPGDIPVTVNPPLPSPLYTSAGGTSIPATLRSGAITVQANPAPFIGSLNPASGSFYGGEQLSVFGSNLSGQDLEVLVGGLPAVVISATPGELQILAPARPSAATDTSVDVVVTHQEGTHTLNGGYQYRLARLTSLSPNTAGVAGQARTIVGQYFPAVTSGITARFGSAGATVLFVNNRTDLGVVVPAGSGTVDVAVTCPGQPEVVLPAAFSYIGAPTIVSVFPPTGSLLGGTSVSIGATGLSAGNVSVTIGGVQATVTQVAPAAATVTVPMYAGFTSVDVPADVVLTTSAGSVTSVGGYTYQVLSLTGLTPALGAPGGGTPVTLQGAGLAAAGTTVNFGGNPATVSQAAASGATLSVQAPAGTGVVDVTVTLADGQSATLPGAFSYVNQLFVGSVSPAQGSHCGGDTVTIGGGGFVAGQIEVTFGSTQATVLTVNPSEITVATPPGIEGTVVSITVTDILTTESGSAIDAFGYGFEFLRGDANGDGLVNVADVSFLANFVLVGGTPPPNPDAGDANDDGLLNVGDVTVLASFLNGGPALPAPNLIPGLDPTPDGLPTCN